MNSPDIYDVSLVATSKARVSPAAREAARAYKKAYHSAYGITPEIRYDGTWFRIAGSKDRVKLARLKTLTKLLHFKQGETR